MHLSRLIRKAYGQEPVDLLLADARVINVYSGKIVPADIAVAGGTVVGFGDYAAKQVVDLKGRYAAPGLIDAHVHIESAMTCVTEFARAVVAMGTTGVVADPHEIANVLGASGIDYMLRSGEGQPMNIYFALPSCVPATEMETSGAVLTARDLRPFMSKDRVVALAEMMNYPAVIRGDADVLEKIRIAIELGLPVDGHAPGLSGRRLSAYLSAGIASDHECTTAAEAEEKLAAGMRIMIREGTGAKNLQALLPVVNERTARRMMWCTDDRHPHDLIAEGHIDAILREAVEAGLDPVTAIQMATLNVAEYFGLSRLGAIAPGKQADIIVFSDLRSFQMEQVYHRGRLVAENGRISPGIVPPASVPCPSSMHVSETSMDFAIAAESTHALVIDIVPDQIVTRRCVLPVSISGNAAVSDPSRDLLKIAVVERHKGTGNIGKGFVRGLGLKKGALASSVAHDSHNIIVVGTTDEDMKAAVAAVIQTEGGLAAVCDQQVRAQLPLPVAGLMSRDPVTRVADRLDRLIEVARNLGASPTDPFMTISFLALPVIPQLKITDRGLVDVERFAIVPLFVR